MSLHEKLLHSFRCYKYIGKCVMVTRNWLLKESVKGQSLLIVVVGTDRHAVGSDEKDNTSKSLSV